ncbi:hypothetical protein [Daejeonella lutea]|uniref:Uncharacterized protein n=1 Tax=Daejeonella lutea TaxID=572036 RepID=A0A1T4ZWF3_9SPHI|nr:hypothetical protein [Daejeonella lutea]SKB27042.1 hypothetical protein SAMN05661099_0009 [Daejeonella lutea]
MYELRPNLILGFHGCDQSVSEALLKNPKNILKSEKPYDWLGHGMYFWENDLERATEWAKNKERLGEIKKASVIGAVIHLGVCCDFLDRSYIKLISSFYELMKIHYEALGIPLPVNTDAKSDPNRDKLLRHLDCATIEFMHQKIFEAYQLEVASSGFSSKKIFDSTRGVFTEGEPAFKGAGLLDKSHIQICIRNLNCIKGFFLPRKETDFIQILTKEYGSK